MLSEAQLWVSAREVRAREMTWTTAERTRRGQPRGSGREWGRAIRDMNSLRESARLKRWETAYPYHRASFPGRDLAHENRGTTTPGLRTVLTRSPIRRTRVIKQLKLVPVNVHGYLFRNALWGSP